MDLTDETADAPQDGDLLAILDAVKPELTARQRQVFDEMRRQFVEEERQKFDPALASQRLGIKPSIVRTHHEDIRARGRVVSAKVFILSLH